jgi:phosphatidylinositol alpha-1,6-mannosyltransferase
MIIITTQCFPPKLGGIENLMGGLAQSIAAKGITVKVYADSAGNSGDTIHAGYEMLRFGGFKPLRRLRKAMAVTKESRRTGVTGIFADSWKSVERLGNTTVPISVLAHGMEFPASPSSSKTRRIRKALAKARTVIASSSYTATVVQPYLDPNQTRLIVINPPIGPQIEAPREDIAALASVVSGRHPVLATLSRLEPRKGIDSVLQALPTLLRKYPSLVYLVGGGGDDLPRLEALASSLQIDHAVKFLGPVTAGRKAALYASADVFAMPTRREGNSVEGFGIVYLEAGWYGLPALATRDGGALDAVRDTETGLLCLPRDIDDVAEKLDRLITDAQGERRMADAARNRARTQAQWDVQIHEYLKTLQASGTE